MRSGVNDHINSGLLRWWGERGSKLRWWQSLSSNFEPWQLKNCNNFNRSPLRFYRSIFPGPVFVTFSSWILPKTRQSHERTEFGAAEIEGSFVSSGWCLTLCIHDVALFFMTQQETSFKTRNQLKKLTSKIGCHVAHQWLRRDGGWGTRVLWQRRQGWGGHLRMFLGGQAALGRVHRWWGCVARKG